MTTLDSDTGRRIGRAGRPLFAFKTATKFDGYPAFATVRTRLIG